MSANTITPVSTSDRLECSINIAIQRHIEEFEKEMVERRQATRQKGLSDVAAERDNQANSRGEEF